MSEQFLDRQNLRVKEDGTHTFHDQLHNTKLDLIVLQLAGKVIKTASALTLQDNFVLSCPIPEQHPVTATASRQRNKCVA